MGKFLGREIIKSIEFETTNTFEGFYSAIHWCTENGYSYGPMQGDAPIALYKGDCAISKWRNLTEKEQNSCDGVMFSNDFREGSVKIIIFNE